MIRYIRIALNLERAAKSALQLSDDRLAAHYLARAEAILPKATLNVAQAGAIIALYDRVIEAAEHLDTDIPITQHCEEMITLLTGYRRGG